MKVSIKQISEVTGFSPATISNALNYKKGVNKETATEIFRVAKELGYLNEETITKIKFTIFKKNGSIVEDTPFFPLLLDGFEKECRNYGYEMVVCNLDQREDDYEAQVKWLLNDSSSAVVLLGTELQDEDFDSFRGAKCPFLLLDNWHPDMSFSGVLINNADSARMAVEYLIEKGHKKIGYLRGGYRIKGFRSRASGFRLGLNKHGMATDNHYTITLGTTMNAAYEDMLNHLQHKPELPTAFFADNDMIALGAIKALQECGYHVPDDISVIGFDDLPFCEIASPRLTTLKVPKQEMGQIAASAIIDLIRKKNRVNTKLQICTSFIERDSVKEYRNE